MGKNEKDTQIRLIEELAVCISWGLLPISVTGILYFNNSCCWTTGNLDKGIKGKKKIRMNTHFGQKYHKSEENGGTYLKHWKKYQMIILYQTKCNLEIEKKRNICFLICLW